MLSQYIRNILFFMIFVTCIGILIPNAKYKKYIDMVTGLILIMLVLRPVVAFIGGGRIPVHRIFAGVDASVPSSVELTDYEAMQNNMLKKTYNELAVKQMQSVLDKEGKYRILSAEIKTSDDFGQIKQISMLLQDIETPTSNRLIWIEPVRIGHGAASEDEDEPPALKNTKKIISDFYNLSLDNIHITVHGSGG